MGLVAEMEVLQSTAVSGGVCGVGRGVGKDCQSSVSECHCQAGGERPGLKAPSCLMQGRPVGEQSPDHPGVR